VPPTPVRQSEKACPQVVNPRAVGPTDPAGDVLPGGQQQRTRTRTHQPGNCIENDVLASRSDQIAVGLDVSKEPLQRRMQDVRGHDRHVPASESRQGASLRHLDVGHGHVAWTRKVPLGSNTTSAALARRGYAPLIGHLDDRRVEIWSRRGMGDPADEQDAAAVAGG